MAFLKSENTNGMPDTMLAKYAAGEASPDENALVEKWMGDNADNRKYADGLFIIMGHIKRSECTDADVHAAWGSLSKKIQQHKKNKTPVRPLFRYMPAAAALLLAAGILLLWNRDQKPSSQKAAAANEIHGNGLRADTLPDGTQILLGNKSVLYYTNDFNHSGRRVQLSGGGHFNVVHDAARPFTIIVNDLEVTDVGTSFSIESDSNKTTIKVRAGAVRIMRKDRSVVLGKGEKLSVVKNDTALQKETGENIIPRQQQRLLQKPAKRLVGDSLQNDPEKQKAIVRNMISDIIAMRLVGKTDSLSWFGLTDEEFIINGQKQHEKVHGAFMRKYRVKKGNGFFYGPVEMTGNGFFITEKELKE